MDWLSVAGIIISAVGVIISFLLFNASINHGRKIFFNELIYFIKHEIFETISLLEEQVSSKEINMEQIEKEKQGFNRALITIHEKLNSLYYNEKRSVPLMKTKQKTNEDGTITSTFLIKKTYKEIIDYFKYRRIDGVDLFLESYYDRLHLYQHYYYKFVFKRYFLIGPVKGVDIVFIRRHKFAEHKGVSTEIPVRKIKNFSSYKKYYDAAYSKFPVFSDHNKKKKFMHEIQDIEITVPPSE